MTISSPGLEAIGIGVAPTGDDKPSEASRTRSSKSNHSVQAQVRSEVTSVVTEPGRDTKLGALLSALRRKKGATIADLMEATGWQAHSVRGAISGALKKKLGLEVTSEKAEGRERVYRIGGHQK
jgi:hypothetical protein